MGYNTNTLYYVAAGNTHERLQYVQHDLPWLT
jgi:hypothetical protein